MAHNEMKNFGLCVIITRPKLRYEEIARVCVECGVEYLQLREKGAISDSATIKAANEIAAITRGSKTRLVINDRPDIAKIVGADMLHLGQDDITLEQARTIVGEQMAIGLSTHSLEQARRAIAQKPDYIGFGPIYPTTTKAMPDPTVGVELLEEVLSFAPIPVVAIGGIFPKNVECVVAAGARNISLVRHLMECESCDELRRRIVELQRLL